jgi:CBS domain-containing protein
MTNTQLLSRSETAAVSPPKIGGGTATGCRSSRLPVTDAVSLRPEEPIGRAIRLLTRSRLAALPVVDAGGSLVGLLTENDLIARLTPRKRSWWATLWMDNTTLIREFRRAMGATVREVMGPSPVPVPLDASAQEAADLLARQGLRELPVVADGRVVGMVARPSLLALQESTQPLVVARTDAELVADMKTRLHEEPWVTNRGLWVEATDGVLFLAGLVESKEEQAALGIMARSIPGCVGVENHTFPRTALRGRWA